MRTWTAGGRHTQRVLTYVSLVTTCFGRAMATELRTRHKVISYEISSTRKCRDVIYFVEGFNKVIAGAGHIQNVKSLPYMARI
jgi:hypothetical protein